MTIHGMITVWTSASYREFAFWHCASLRLPFWLSVGIEVWIRVGWYRYDVHEWVFFFISVGLDQITVAYIEQNIYVYLHLDV